MLTTIAFAGRDVANQAIAAVIEMESKVRETALDWLILRGGFFYGPGTGYDDEWFARAKSGKLRLPAAGEDFVTLVHITDMATAALAALKRWPSRHALVVADNEPTRWRDLFGYVARIAGGPPPPAGGPARMPSFRVRNDRARASLAWSPHYPDYRSGLAR